MDKVKILFVCMGNICRSPAAEGIMKSLITREGLNEKIEVDSAGTIPYHSGELPDPRMRRHAALRGYNLESRARHFDQGIDFDKFDYIIAMDEANYSYLQSFNKGEYSGKLFKLSRFAGQVKFEDVPDPYYSGAQGFEKVLDLLEDACGGLLENIKNEYRL